MNTEHQKVQALERIADALELLAQAGTGRHRRKNEEIGEDDEVIYFNGQFSRFQEMPSSS